MLKKFEDSKKKIRFSFKQIECALFSGHNNTTEMYIYIIQRTGAEIQKL